MFYIPVIFEGHYWIPTSIILLLFTVHICCHLIVGLDPIFTSFAFYFSEAYFSCEIELSGLVTV